MKKKNLQVLKSWGDLEAYHGDKLKKSLLIAGLDHEEVDRVMKEIEPDLFNEIPTSKIHDKVLSKINDFNRAIAGRYNIKRSIMNLGPSGYPFEQFMASLFKSEGYEVSLNCMIPGKCVDHEVDLVLTNNGFSDIVECKFHTENNGKCNVKTPLYVCARYLDISDKWEESKEYESDIGNVWLITNSKFTKDALKYGVCAGIKMMSWSFPNEGSVSDLIEKHGNHPVTCIPSLTDHQKKLLISNGYVLCKQVCEDREILGVLGFSKAQEIEIRREASIICKYFGQEHIKDR